MSGSVGKIAGAAVGSAIGGSGSGGGGNGPRKIRTGNSTFSRRKGSSKFFDIALDPTIREGQETFLDNVRGLRSDVDPAFDTFLSGISDLRGDVGELRSSFEGNQSAFREASLRPLQEKISTRRGALTSELGRTGVRGSFRNNELNKFETGAGIALSDQEAKIENERINNLGNLLGMDADLLKAGLTGETGRTNLLLGLEESLRGVSTERFAQEMAMLGFPLGQTNPTGQLIDANQKGIQRQLTTQFAGEIFGGLDELFGGSDFGDGGGSFGNTFNT